MSPLGLRRPADRVSREGSWSLQARTARRDVLAETSGTGAINEASRARNYRSTKATGCRGGDGVESSLHGDERGAEVGGDGDN